MLLLLSVLVFPSFVGYRQPSVFSQSRKMSSLFISDSQLSPKIKTLELLSDLTVRSCFAIPTIYFYIYNYLFYNKSLFFVLLFYTEHINK